MVKLEWECISEYVGAMRNNLYTETRCIKRNTWCIKRNLWYIKLTHSSLKKEIKGVRCVLSKNAGT